VVRRRDLGGWLKMGKGSSSLAKIEGSSFLKQKVQSSEF